MEQPHKSLCKKDNLQRKQRTYGWSVFHRSRKFQINIPEFQCLAESLQVNRVVRRSKAGRVNLLQILSQNFFVLLRHHFLFKTGSFRFESLKWDEL